MPFPADVVDVHLNNYVSGWRSMIGFCAKLRKKVSYCMQLLTQEWVEKAEGISLRCNEKCERVGRRTM